MTTTEASVQDHLSKLDAARKLVLADPALYPQIVKGIVPHIGVQARLELRRWGVDFLAEMFASPQLATMHKQSLSLMVLETLQAVVEMEEQDTAVLKSAVQASASIYPLVFRHIISNADDETTWAKMTAIKSKILKMWDDAAMGVRVCCVKFVQRVVQVQTRAGVGDPRKPNTNETSLSLVPRDHVLIPPSNLEAEASGLLDRLLSIFQEDTRDSIMITATLNSLSTLIRTRPPIANKIIYAILNFDPFKQAKAPLTPKSRVMIRSMERTTRAVLINVNKQNPSGPLAPRIHQYIERLAQARLEVFDETSRKRGAPTEPTDGLDPAKRAKLAAQIPETKPVPQVHIPPLPPGPVSVTQLFTLTADRALMSFDVTQLPAMLVIQMLLPALYHANPNMMNQAVEGIQARLTSIEEHPPVAPPVAENVTNNVTEEDEEDDYEPDFEPVEDLEQMMNKMDHDGLKDNSKNNNNNAMDVVEESVEELAPYKLPPPPILTRQELMEINQGTIQRVFGMMDSQSDSAVVSNSSIIKKSGINRLAASKFDKNAWLTMITRLGSRASSALDEDDDEEEEDEQGSKSLTITRTGHVQIQRQKDQKYRSLRTQIHEKMYLYILEDFRKRIDTAVSWLTEEWYNERIQHQQHPHPNTPPAISKDDGRIKEGGGYEKLALKILDGLLPYLDTRDKIFTRFISELPEITNPILTRVKALARDPERVGLAVNTLHFMILFRPPAREICIDAIEDLWRNYDDARPSAEKVLKKWRPRIFLIPEIDEKDDKEKEGGNVMPVVVGGVENQTEEQTSEVGQAVSES